MPGPDLERQFLALRQGYAERLPSRIETLEAMATRLATRWDPAAALELQRELHNLAGSGASYGFPELSRAARQAEDACATALAGAGAQPLAPMLAAVSALATAVAADRA